MILSIGIIIRVITSVGDIVRTGAPIGAGIRIGTFIGTHPITTPGTRPTIILTGTTVIC